MITTDARLKGLAAELDAGLIARREFLRKSATITGGTAVGLSVLRGMASAQPKTRLRIWLFKSYVTGATTSSPSTSRPGPRSARSNPNSTGPPSAIASRSSSRRSRLAILRTSRR